MPKCHNCGNDQLGIIVQHSSCAVPRCLNEVRVVEGSTDNFFCPFHQQEFSTRIKNLEGSIITPTQEIQDLRTENQRLTTTLSLKDIEKNDLQAQIRALHTQLSERENNQPFQKKIDQLSSKLELVKKKLGE